MVRSLNLAVRKRETERIERENQAFAKRLFDKQPNFDRKELDEAYKQHLKFKKALKKVEVARTSADNKKIPKRVQSLSKSNTNEAKNTNTASVVQINDSTSTNVKQEPILEEKSTELVNQDDPTQAPAQQTV